MSTNAPASSGTALQESRYTMRRFWPFIERRSFGSNKHDIRAIPKWRGIAKWLRARFASYACIFRRYKKICKSSSETIVPSINRRWEAPSCFGSRKTRKIFNWVHGSTEVLQTYNHGSRVDVRQRPL